MADTDPDLTLQASNTVPPRPMPGVPPRAYLVHIYPPGPTLGVRYPLTDIPLVLGRDTDCDISIDDPSISRHHARFQPDGDCYNIMDLHSTNGTAVNKVTVSQCKLQDGDDLRFGNCLFRFLASGNVEARYHEEIYRLTVSDPLTNIPNRRYLLQFLERELYRSSRYRRALALLLFDVDHFKMVNDEFGHLAGDFTLRELANCVKGVIRKEGLFGRFGGEEFAVILPEATLEMAIAVAERIRQRVEKHAFEFDGRGFAITISLGVTATVGTALLTAEDFLHRADERLYQAKSQGRNRLVADAPAQVRKTRASKNSAT